MNDLFPNYVPPNEKIIMWEICFADMRGKPTNLLFHARQETALTGVTVPRRPGISLKWKGTRIRGVNWNIRHDNLLNGEVIAPIYGWHEKQYTEIDEDKHLVDINDEVKNADLRSIIQFCCDRWNIESPEEFQYRIGDL